jgi:hypothetical protein
MRFTLFFVNLLFWGQMVNAQCVLKKAVKDSVTTIETNESYIYSRTDKQYHAIAFKAISVKRPSGTKTLLDIKYTSTKDGHAPKALFIKFINGDMITIPLIFTARTKSDNQALSNINYRVILGKTDIDKINSLQAKAMGVLSPAANTLAEIAFTDGTLLQQLLTCLKN